MTSNDIATKLTLLLGRTPDWIRKDFASKDATTRARAEESLAAILTDGLGTETDQPR